MPPVPAHVELDRAKGLTIRWADSSESFYPVEYLRRMSPSADARQLRAEMARNPLTVLPSSPAGTSGPLTAVEARLVGNYAINIRFSDGHDTGIFSWQYLREIDPAHREPSATDPPT